MKTNLIGISGKIGSGKDTVGKILQYLNQGIDSNKQIIDYINGAKIVGFDYQIKKYADKLKGGCEYDFSNEFSVKEWETGDRSYRDEIMPSLGISRRDFLLKKGDNCRAIHSDYFVNALFADYNYIPGNRYHGDGGSKEPNRFFPNWIITDVRFPNEVQAIKDRGGIVIRVNVYCYDSLEDYLVTHPDIKVSRKAIQIIESSVYDHVNSLEEKLKEIPESRGYYNKSNHPSETALDDYEFDHVIDNSGSIEELVEKVKQLKLV